MIMNVEALLEEYVSGHSDKEKYVRTVVGIFVSHGIKEPTKKDYEETLRYGLQEKGIKGKSSYYNYKSAGKGFYEWLSTKGDKVMNETEVIDAMKKSEHETEPSTESEVDSRDVKADTDSEETSDTSTSKGKGRPKKAESDKRKNSFSVYLSESSAEALRDLSRYDRKDISVLLAEIIEMFISKNEDILTEYRTFYKNRKQLRQ